MATAIENGQRGIYTTSQLKELLDQGYEIYLPEVVVEQEDRDSYTSFDLRSLKVPAASNPITSISFIGREKVQCIEIADEDHLYLTNDFIPTHNTSNIVFLKSTDDSMIDTLQKMSGTRHVAYRDSKTITRDSEKLIKSVSVEGKVSYTMSVKEEPVVSYNDMAFISERNSIVFRAGDAPVWNRNETILPMSWKMFGDMGEDSIVHPGHDYTLQTIPTLSTAKDFDVRMNQPDFNKMVLKRIEQAAMVPEAEEKYQSAFGYTERDIQLLDPDIYADDIMGIVAAAMREEEALAKGLDPDNMDDDEGFDISDMWAISEDREQAELYAEQEAFEAGRKRGRYAGNQISQADLVSASGVALHGLDEFITLTYRALQREMSNDSEFMVDNMGNLRLRATNENLISLQSESEAKSDLKAAMEAGQRVFAEEDGDIDAVNSWIVEDAFYQYLASLDSWLNIARGQFDRRMALLAKDGIPES